MSGIVGIYYLDDRPVDREDLGRMVDILAHRGPDGAEIWSEGAVGLGHRMLWTTPESLLEKLPLTNHRSDLILTTDARIDNREEAIAALGLTESPAEKLTDSQIILAAYEQWGEQCPEKLLGDFAFAIWDKRKQQLFCARDPMGVKPFYYYRSNRLFVFASEIKALLCLSEIPRRLNEIRIGEYLLRNFEDKAITFYQNIWRLPGAHRLTVRGETIQLQAYWSLDPSREVRLNSNREYAEAYREIFTEAVRCRLRSAFPVGSMLSGGLDSSSIACTARNVLQQTKNRDLHTFSAIFPSLSAEARKLIDERPYLEIVIATGGFIPHYIRADCLSPLADLDRVFWHIDEAFMGPNLYMHWALYKAANQQQVRVLLDGIDGDSTVSHGLAYLSDLARTGRWKMLIRESRALARNYKMPVRRAVWQWGLQPLLLESFESLWQVFGTRLQPLGKSTIINPAFARRIQLAQHVEALSNGNSVPTRTSREQHWHSLNSGLLSYMLELADKSASAFSLEARYPFCDRRLLEFCLALPPEQKFSQGWTRLIARRAMAGILPPQVQRRICKANLGPNFKRKLLDRERESLDKVILNQPQILQDYINVSALRAAYHRYASHPLREQDSLTVYGAVNLALWLRRTGFTA